MKATSLAHYRTPAGVEVDFIIETSRKRPQRGPTVVAGEVKRAKHWDRTWKKPMCGLAATASVKVDRIPENTDSPKSMSNSACKAPLDILSVHW
ncbi:MAG: hypothetical protein SWQ30_20710 [Thermodesulfobacteriota bacterium]|nr:hypothetical protein [Thermodesulfobacteriota bacterium]